MVLINNFRSHLVKVKVAKKPDKQHLDLLVDEDEDTGGIWNTISRLEKGCCMYACMYLVFKCYPAVLCFFPQSSRTAAN